MPSELTQKIDMALKRIETFQRPEGLYLAFSGGKDSVVTKRLLDMAAVYLCRSAGAGALYPGYLSRCGSGGAAG